MSLFRIGITLLLGLTASCSNITTYEVEYPLSYYPNQKMAELKTIGVSPIKRIAPKSTSYLVSQIKKCSTYGKTVLFDSALKIKGKSPSEIASNIKKDLDKLRSARGAQGALVVEILDNKGTFVTKPTEIVKITDLATHTFQREFGLLKPNTFGLSNTDLLAPESKYTVSKTPQTQKNYSMKVRFVLYNKILNTVAVDKTVQLSAQVTHHSSKAEPFGRRARQVLTKGILDEIVKNACPGTGRVIERTLYAKDEQDKTNKIILEGIELVDEGKWQTAADKWHSILLEEKTNAFAHHNLGVHYERLGELGKSNRHFFEASGGVHSKIILENQADQYFESLDSYLPKLNFKQTQPIISSVDSGHWVRFIPGNHSRKIKANQTYSIFRSSNILDKNNEPIGLNLLEVGKIKVIKVSKTYGLARVKTHLKSTPIAPGDFIYY